MNETNKTALAAAVAGGYVLGRTKKGKIALAVTSYFAARRLGLDPQEVAEAPRRLAAASPGTKAGGDLVNAGKAALSAIVGRRIDSLADALHERTEALRAGPEEEPGEDEDGQDRGRRRGRRGRAREEQEEDREDGEDREDEEEDGEDREDRGEEEDEEEDGRGDEEDEDQEDQERPARRPARGKGEPRRDRAADKPGKRPEAKRPESRRKAPAGKDGKRPERKAPAERASRSGTSRSGRGR